MILTFQGPCFLPLEHARVVFNIPDVTVLPSPTLVMGEFQVEFPASVEARIHERIAQLKRWAADAEAHGIRECFANDTTHTPKERIQMIATIARIARAISSTALW
jgi:hypothetical protein